MMIKARAYTHANMKGDYQIIYIVWELFWDNAVIKVSGNNAESLLDYLLNHTLSESHTCLRARTHTQIKSF